MSALQCSFCGKSKDAVKVFVSGPNGVLICSGCVAICVEIIVDALPDTDRALPSDRSEK